MAMAKRSMTGLDIAALVREAWRLLEGARVSNVYQVGEVVEVRLRGPGGKVSLVMSPPTAVLVTERELSPPSVPPRLAAELRRIARGRLVRVLRQVGLDRVLSLVLDRGAEIVYEGVREGNIVGVSGGSIVAVLRERRMRDRDVVVGAPYTSPPPRGLDPLSLSEDDVARVLKGGRGRAAAVLSRAINAPGEAIAEAIYRSGGDPRGAAETVRPTRFVDALRGVLLEALRGRPRGYIAYREGQCLGVYPFEPTHLGVEVEEVESFLEAVEEYFIPLIEESVAPRIESGAAERALELAREYEFRASALRAAAEEVFASLPRFESLMARARQLKSEGRMNELSREYPKVVSVDPATGKVVVEIAGVKVAFSVSESVARVAARLYDEAKKLERKAARAKKEAARLVVKPPARRPLFRLREREAWYSPYLHFVSSEGFLVVGGRDASQNEALVKRYMEPHDIFLHADVHGGPVVIVKTEGKEPGRRTIEEAAQLAAAFSRAWEHGFQQIDVYWVKGNQVSKRAPSGEYLGKGAFMVYGKREYLKVPLRLAIGIKLEREGVELKYGPPSVVAAECLAYVELAPGRLDRKLTAEKVREYLIRAASEEGVRVKIQLQEVLNCLPKGGFYFLRHVKRGRHEEQA